MFAAALIKCIIVVLKTLISIRVSVLLLKTSQNPHPTLQRRKTTDWLASGWAKNNNIKLTVLV